MREDGEPTTQVGYADSNPITSFQPFMLSQFVAMNPSRRTLTEPVHLHQIHGSRTPHRLPGDEHHQILRP